MKAPPMSDNLSYLAEQIKAQTQRISEQTKSVQFDLEFSDSAITLKATFDTVNKLGIWFSCSVYEKRLTLSNEIIGTVVEYFDSNNYIHYFLNGNNRNEKALKLLAIIYQEFKKGEMGILVAESKFHISHISPEG